AALCGEEKGGPEPRAGDAEDRPRQERVGLSGARAEVRRDDRVRDVDRDPEHRDPGCGAEVVAAGIELCADEQERETCRKRRPEPCEMPDRAAAVERHDSAVARRVAMLDRLVEGLTLEREVFPQLRYVVRVLLGRMMVEVAWAFRHRQLLLSSCAICACESVTKG